MILNIKVEGEWVLREKSKKILKITADIKKMIKDMIDTMRAARGIGIAAPQIGRNIRVIVIEGKEPIVMINPEILSMEGEIEGEEACLSVPGVWGRVKRAEKVTVRFMNSEGRSVIIGTGGYLARIIQHEVDHLDGVLYIDKAVVVENRSKE